MTDPGRADRDADAEAVTTLLREALAHQRRREFAPAEARCRDVLARAPDHFDALHLLGVLRYAQGRADEAIALIGRALRVDPAHAAAHSNLGLAQQKAGRYAEALASFDRALALRPDHAATLFNRGNALRALGDPAAALASYERALALAPNDANALCNRGIALRRLGRHAEALASLDRALALVPDDVDALYHRGRALQDLGHPQDALAAFARALSLAPDAADALYGRANALLALGRHDEARASYDRLLALKPGHEGALNNRGVALAGLGQFEAAIASYDEALARHPATAEVLTNRGNALQSLRRHEEALAAYDRALAIDPNHADAHYGRGNALTDLRRFEEAVASYARTLELAPDYPYAKGQLLHLKMSVCDWAGLEPLAEAVRRDVVAGKKAAEPFGFQAVSASPRELQRCAELYAAERYPRSPASLYEGPRAANPRIRIGYLSGEFRHQATSILMAELFELHDRDRFELYAFDNGFDDGSEIRRRIVAAFAEIVPIAALSDRDAAAAVHARRIDILVNLNGYFGRARQGVFAQRPAPVQVNYLGFPGTLGADYVDYIVADRVVIPPDERAFYTERVAWLPDTYQVNDRKRRIAAATPSRASAGLPPDGTVFCCFNNNYKLTPAMFDVWMRILARTPASVLWLLEDNAAAARNLRTEAQARGIAPGRIVLAPRVRLDEHLARHRNADLFLDSLPYNAHTTASDALWAGVPVLTVLGTSFPGRVAASLLGAIGLPELVAPDLAAYESLAVNLAATPERLAAIRARLAANRATAPLFDPDRFRRHLEAAYLEMWERHRRGEAPASFAVAPLA